VKGVSLLRQTFTVPEISCEHCKSTIEGALKPLTGVAEAVVEIEAKRVGVQYDPEVVTKGQLVAAIEDAGYDVPG
jgi:copper chaperone